VPCRIQHNYNFADSVFSNQLNVSPFPLEICGQFDERYTPNLLPNTARISRLRHVNPGLCKILCNCSFAYWGFNIHLVVSTLPLEICRQLLRYILLIYCQIQGTSAGLPCVNSVPCDIPPYFSFWDCAWNIQLNASQFLFQTSQQYDARSAPHLLPNEAHISPFALSQLCVLSNRGICPIGDSAWNIQLHVSPFPLEICRNFDARSTPHLLPNTAHLLLFTLCQRWSLSNPL
jgi:hypothetical protein